MGTCRDMYRIHMTNERGSYILLPTVKQVFHWPEKNTVISCSDSTRVRISIIPTNKPLRPTEVVNEDEGNFEPSVKEEDVSVCFGLRCSYDNRGY
jgi:hypothetical protein